MQNTEQISTIESKIKFDNYRLKYLKIYRDYKPISEQYKTAANQDKFFRKHEDELLLFREAVEELKKTESSKTLPNVAVLKKEIQALDEQKTELFSENSAIDKKLHEYDMIKKNLEKILDDTVFSNEHEKLQKSRETQDKNSIHI